MQGFAIIVHLSIFLAFTKGITCPNQPQRWKIQTAV